MRDAGIIIAEQSASGAGLAGLAMGSGAANGTVLWRYVAAQKINVFEVGVIQDSSADIGSAVVLTWTQETGSQVGAGTGTSRATTSGTAATTTFRGKALSTKVSFNLEKGDALVLTLTTKSANASVTAFGYFQGYPHGQGLTESNEQSVSV